MPIPPYEDTTFDACGTTLAWSIGDQFGVRERVTEKQNGVLYEYKGPMSTDITAPDGGSIDELDNSGYFSVFERNDGALVFDVHGPALVYAFTPEEAAAFEAAGLPEAFYYRNGKLVFITRADGTVTIREQPRRVVDVCDLLT